METLGSPLVDPALLPNFAAWAVANPGYTLAEHAYPELQPDQFFAVGALLWPTFVRHEDGLFLADGFSVDAFDKWFAQTASLTATERMMNHRHMRDMLRSFVDAPRELLLSAAKLMQQCWEGRLNQLCPGTAVTVDMYETTSDVEITFHVIRPQQTVAEAVPKSSPA